MQTRITSFRAMGAHSVVIYKQPRGICEDVLIARPLVDTTLSMRSPHRAPCGFPPDGVRSASVWRSLMLLARSPSRLCLRILHSVDRRRLLRLAYHIVHRCLDLLIRQRGVAALRRHYPLAALETLDGMLVKRVVALRDARLPCGFVTELWCTANTLSMTGDATAIVDLLTLFGTACGRRLASRRGASASAGASGFRA